MDKDSPKRARWTDPDTGRIVRHPYERSPYSGAGNCWCGRWDDHPLHLDAPQPEPKPTRPGAQLRGTDAAREAIRQARGHEAVPQAPILFSHPPQE